MADRLHLPLNTERLSLRLHRANDSNWLHDSYSQHKVATYILDEPWTPSEAEIQTSKRLARKGLDSPAGSLALVIEQASKPIGDVTMWYTNQEHGIVEIGWVLDPAASGKGYAAEAVRAVLASIFDAYGLHRVVAQMDARNASSARLATAVGMRQEAHLRQDWWNKNEWTDTLIYARLSSDK